MKRASSRKKAVKVPAAAAVADATSDEEPQVSAESVVEATLLARSKSNNILQQRDYAKARNAICG